MGEEFSNFDLGTSPPTEVDYVVNNFFLFAFISSMPILLGFLLVLIRRRQFNNIGKTGEAFPVVLEENDDEMHREIRDLDDRWNGLMWNVDKTDRENMTIYDRKVFDSESDRFSKLLDKYKELDSNRIVTGAQVEYTYISSAEWFNTRQWLLFLYFLVLSVLMFVHYVDMGVDDSWNLKNIFTRTEDKFKYSSLHTLRGINKWFTVNSWGYISPMPWIEQDEYVRFIQAYEFIGILDKYLSIIFHLDDFSFDILLAVYTSVALFIYFLLGERNVNILVKLENTPLTVDLRPDDMRKLGIRHKDAKLSEVEERPNFLYRFFTAFTCLSVQRYVVSYELVCQLATPSHFNYGASQEDVLHKMSHSASVTCQINIDRYDYTRTNCFENSVRLAKFIYMSRALAIMQDF